jgi:transposase InsO family protein
VELKLRGPIPWTYYYLYVILDVFSRAVVGWLIAEREDAELAEALIAETCTKEGIMPSQLTIHADRGSAMTSTVVAQLLSDLGVSKTHSRPHVSNDNPFSEAQCAPRHAAVDRSRRELEREGRFQGHPPQAEPKGGADRSMVGTRLRLRGVAS